MHTRSQNYLWLLGAGAASATGGAVERTKIVLDFWYISALLSLFGSCPPALPCCSRSFHLRQPAVQ